jgi:2-keto-3-deoxy-L-rhamnonate aldolase RhmA
MPLNLQQQRLKDGKTVIAVNVAGKNPDVMQALSKSGAHMAFIDCERTGIGIDAATELIRAAKLANLTAIVRSWSKDPTVLVQYLDRQVDGLVVPHINTPKDVADVVELFRYACGDKSADKTIIVQIETVEAINNLDAIMQVPGVDAYLIGPNDLAYDMTGVRGARTPDVLNMVDHVSERLRLAEKRFGMPADWSQLEHFQQLGATFLYFPIEWLIDKALKDLNGLLGIAKQ